MKHVDVLLVGYERQENLGLRYIAAFLIARGYRVVILPFSADDSAAVVDAAVRYRPVLIGLSLIFQYTLPEFEPLLSELRARDITAHITAGGHYPTLRPRETFNHLPQLNSIVRFEGEETAAELTQALKSGQDWRVVPGIAFNGPDGFQLTPPRRLIDPLDLLPWPVRGETISAGGVRADGGLPILARRGCLYDCAFCSIREFYHGTSGRARRVRSPRDVVAEMKHLFDTTGARIFLFQDDDFALRGGRVGRWVREFLVGLDNAGLSDNIVWKVSSRVDDIEDPELLAECRKRGLLAVYLGVESGNPDGLATLRKRVTVEQNLNALRLLHSQGISFDLGFMLFDPDSTFQSVSTNLGFLECISELGGPPLSFVKMLPLAGTAIEQRLQREGRLKGTELRPDYRLQDPRLELFSLFTTVVFSDRNSSPQGFVESFRRAHFLGVVCARSDNSAAVTEYNEELSGLIRKGNESALRLLRETLEFVERLPDARSVALAWPTLRRMADAEEQYWSELLEALDGLQCQGPSLGWPRLFGSVSPTALGTS